MAKILLVEDDALTAYAIRLLLEAEGYEVCCAANGLEGLETARTESPDLILTDHAMPKMKGLTMVKKIRDEGIGAPVILASGIAEDRLGGGPEAGYDVYLRKPFSEGDLLTTARLLIDQSMSDA